MFQFQYLNGDWKKESNITWKSTQDKKGERDVIMGKKRRGDLPSIPDIGIPSGIAVSPITPPALSIEPIGAVEKPEEEIKPIAVSPMPKITNTFKPSIDISFRKSKKFINQQVIVK